MNAGALDVLDRHITLLRDRLSTARARADRVAAKRGERQVTADRLCEYYAHLLEQTIQARSAVAELVEAAKAALPIMAANSPTLGLALRAALTRYGVGEQA